MNKFLKKIKLAQELITEIDIQKEDFVTKLKNQVDKGGTDMFSDTFDVFSSSKNIYKGYVDFEYFQIKKRRKFFDMNMNMAVAKGDYTQKGEKLIINTEINGLSGFMIPFIILILVFYTFSIGTFFISDNNVGGDFVFFFPFFILQALFMIGFPYFLMKRSVKNMKHELEREFYFLTK